MMKKIILFRSPQDGNGNTDPYHKMLSSESSSVYSIPALSFEFVNLEELSMALSEVENYSGILFTSRRSVEAVEKVISHLNDWLTIKSKWKEKPSYAVGTTTCQLATTLGFTVSGEETGNAKELASFILKTMQKSSKPFLYPCGNLKRDVLSKVLVENGYDVGEIMVYKTSPSTTLEKDIKNFIQHEGLPTTLVYFSPSGVRFTYEILQKHGVPIKDLEVVAIGPSTEEELNKYKIAIYGTARKPTPESLSQVFTKEK